MQLLLFRLKQLRNLNRLYNATKIVKRGVVFILPFYLFLFCRNVAVAQVPIITKQDTISLSLFEYAEFNTNNGSACVYYISNPSNADIATVVNIGGPDSLKLNDTTYFNGIHELAPGRQLIAVGNFMGKKISTINLSSKATTVTLMFYCPR